VSPLVDGLFVGLGSLLCFLYYRFLAPGYSVMQVSEGAIFLSTLLGWVGSWPHFSATAWRLYGSSAHLKELALTAWLVPALVILATAACFVYPVSFAPYFIKLFILWSPWHFSLQTFGITLIYARRAGIELPSKARTALAVFFVSSFLAQYAEAERSLSASFFYAVSYPHLSLPALAPKICLWLTYASLAAFAYFLLPFRARLPWILILPVATQYLWFVHGRKDISFQLLLPIFHGIQYLLIAWALEMHQRGSLAPSLASLRWMGVNFLVGGLFFFGLPQLLHRLGGWSLAFSTLVIFASISVHHYLVDGVIWKLRREQGKSPLFLNVRHAWSRK
jgi:hypothetical protein